VAASFFDLSSRPIDRRRFLAGAAGAAALAGLAACSTGADKPAAPASSTGPNRKKIAFAQPDTSFAGYPLLLNGAKQAAQERGYTLLESHANAKLDAQVSEINTWIGQEIGGIMVLPLDNNAMAPLITKAHQNGVKILDYSDKALEGADGWVIFDNLQGAKLVGEHAGNWVNQKLGGQAQVALLTHEVQQTGRDRINGAVEALKKVAPGVKVVAQQEGVLSAESLTVVQSMLQAHPDINVLFCIADDGCLGAEKAFMQRNPSQERQDKMYIAGWDGTMPVFQKILAKSVIRSTGALDLIKIGAASVNATADAIEGKPAANTQISFPYVLVDQDHPEVTQDFVNRYQAITPA
jgi:ribose transport system substrate-binding protein